MAPVSLEGKRELLRVTVPKAYLERAKGQFKEPLDLDGILRGEGEDDVVDSKEGDQQEGGLGQAPADTNLLWYPAPPHGHSSESPHLPHCRGQQRCPKPLRFYLLFWRISNPHILITQGQPPTLSDHAPHQEKKM